MRLKRDSSIMISAVGGIALDINSQNSPVRHAQTDFCCSILKWSSYLWLHPTHKLFIFPNIKYISEKIFFTFDHFILFIHFILFCQGSFLVSTALLWLDVTDKHKQRSLEMFCYIHYLWYYNNDKMFYTCPWFLNKQNVFYNRPTFCKHVHHAWETQIHNSNTNTQL